MQEITLDIQTTAGAMETFITHPDRNGPHPAIIMLMDAPGIRDELRHMATRLATAGYTVLLPNLYYRAGRDTLFGPGVLEPGHPDRDRMRAIRTRMTIPPVMDDIAAILNVLQTFPPARPGPVGTHGYCMSGPYALAAAARYPTITAAASIYGTWLISDATESPHTTLNQSKAELYIACAETDDLAPPPMVAELQSLLATSTANAELEIYPNTHHGFAFPQRKIYNHQAAERHWERLIALYKRNLG